MEDITFSVLEIARRHVDPGSAGTLTEESALGLDSLKTIGFMLELETHFNFEFPEDLVDMAAFASVDSAVRAIRLALSR